MVGKLDVCPLGTEIICKNTGEAGICSHLRSMIASRDRTLKLFGKEGIAVAYGLFCNLA